MQGRAKYDPGVFLKKCCSSHFNFLHSLLNMTLRPEDRASITGYLAAAKWSAQQLSAAIKCFHKLMRQTLPQNFLTKGVIFNSQSAQNQHVSLILISQTAVHSVSAWLKHSETTPYLSSTICSCYGASKWSQTRMQAHAVSEQLHSACLFP